MSIILNCEFHQDTLIPESLYQKVESLGEIIDNYNPLRPLQLKVDKFVLENITPYLPKNKKDLENAPLESLNICDKINKFLDEEHTNETKLVQAVFFTTLLIPKVLRNIVGLVYNTLKLICEFCVHPLDTIASCILFLSRAILALKDPKLFSSAGAGVIGLAIGQGIITPQSIIAYIVGASLIGVGFLYGAIKAAVNAEEGGRWEAVIKELEDQIKDLPESFLTGLLMGVTLGAIEIASILPKDGHSADFVKAADDAKICP